MTVAPRLKMAVGVNVTLTVQVPLLAATEPPQVLATEKSPGLAPVSETLVMVRLTLPVLVSVMDCAGVLVVPTVCGEKFKVVPLRLTMGLVPVPVSVTGCTLPPTLSVLSVMFMVAPRLPMAAGVNVTLMVQLLFAATDPLQVLVCPKSPGLAPANPMLAMVRAVLPVLLRVTV